ncbi:MAG: CDP-diacylglycerol--serine O-phosphatidyltransferase [Candidatus Wallbacteria bacterium]
MKKVYAYAIPCTFTAANLFCGFAAIQFIIKKDFTWAAWYIFFSMVFDIMDGRIARMTSGTSMFGAEFDSLADLVSFGVAPSMLVYYNYMESTGVIGIFVSFLFILCGALRLARFNIMPHKPYFQGLPIPGGAAFAASLVLLGTIYNLERYTNIITFGMFVTSLLMISLIPYPALKQAKKNKLPLFKRVLIQIGFWLLIVTIYIISIPKAIFFATLSYLISGIIFMIYRFVTHAQDIDEEHNNHEVTVSGQQISEQHSESQPNNNNENK